MKKIGTMLVGAFLLTACGGKDKSGGGSAPAPKKQVEAQATSVGSIELNETSTGVNLTRDRKIVKTFQGAKVVKRSSNFVVVENLNSDRILFNKVDQIGQVCPRNCDILISNEFAVFQRRTAQSSIVNSVGHTVAKIDKSARLQFKLSNSFVVYQTPRSMKLFRKGGDEPLSQCVGAKCDVEISDGYAFVYNRNGQISLFDKAGVQIMNTKTLEAVDVKLSEVFAFIQPNVGGILYHIDGGKKVLFNCGPADCKVEVSSGFAAISNDSGQTKIFNRKGISVFDIVSHLDKDMNISDNFAYVSGGRELKLFHRDRPKAIYSCAFSDCEADISDDLALVGGGSKTSAFNKFGEKIY